MAIFPNLKLKNNIIVETIKNEFDGNINGSLITDNFLSTFFSGLVDIVCPTCENDIKPVEKEKYNDFICNNKYTPCNQHLIEPTTQLFYSICEDVSVEEYDYMYKFNIIDPSSPNTPLRVKSFTTKNGVFSYTYLPSKYIREKNKKFYSWNVYDIGLIKDFYIKGYVENDKYNLGLHIGSCTHQTGVGPFHYYINHKEDILINDIMNSINNCYLSCFIDKLYKKYKIKSTTKRTTYGFIPNPKYGNYKPFYIKFNSKINSCFQI
jgi:hypothetical protein